MSLRKVHFNFPEFYATLYTCIFHFNAKRNVNFNFSAFYESGRFSALSTLFRIVIHRLGNMQNGCTVREKKVQYLISINQMSSAGKVLVSLIWNTYLHYLVALQLAVQQWILNFILIVKVWIEKYKKSKKSYKYSATIQFRMSYIRRMLANISK